jgi:hypothetical protein
MTATLTEMRSGLTSDEATRFSPDLGWASVPFIERSFAAVTMTASCSGRRTAASAA